jgi:hypothetical protein
MTIKFDQLWTYFRGKSLKVSTSESVDTRLSTIIYTPTDTSVRFTREIPRNPEEYFSYVYLVGSETGKIVTGEEKHWLEASVNV